MSAAADALMGIFGFKRVEGEMSKSVEEVRRAAFEKWAVTRRHPTNGLPFFVMKNESGKYLDGTTEYAWEGFNAALDAVEIQLPERDAKGSGSPDSEMGASLEQYEAVAYNFALEDCRAAIEQTGLGLRVL